MGEIGVIARIGMWCHRHRRAAVILWIVALVALLSVSGMVGSDYAEDLQLPDSDSRNGIDVLDEHFEGFGTGFTGSIVFRTERGVTDPDVVAAMNDMFGARVVSGGFVLNDIEKLN